MRAIIDCIKVSSLQAEFCFHLIMDLFQFLERHLSSSNNRLICDYNCKITGRIDFLDCLCHTINQLKVINISKEPDIFIDRTIPVEKHSFLLI